MKPTRADLLAVGLEKGRGESVLVYDVQRTVASNSRDQSGARHGGLHREPSQHSRGRASSPAASNTSAYESAPLLTFGVSDFVTSLSFLPSGPGGQTSGALLATAAAGKWIRVFDLRSPPATVTTWTSRAGYGLAPNPFNAQQLSSFGEDGICRLWDLRKPLDPLLSFSEADAGAIPLQTVTNSAPRPLAETTWCPSRPGTFATLEKESSTIRLWSLVDGPGPRLLYSRTESRTNDRYVDQNNANEALRMPILLEDRQSKIRLSQKLARFQFAEICSLFFWFSSSSVSTSAHLFRFRFAIVETIYRRRTRRTRAGYEQRRVRFAAPGNRLGTGHPDRRLPGTQPARRRPTQQRLLVPHTDGRGARS